VYLQLIADPLFADPEKLKFRDDKGGSLAQIGPLGKVNLLVGANNSGKSRFLRALYEMGPQVFWKYEQVVPNLQQAIGHLNEEPQHAVVRSVSIAKHRLEKGRLQRILDRYRDHHFTISYSAAVYRESLKLLRSASDIATVEQAFTKLDTHLRLLRKICG
jgi:predicted ATP-dependent endonuclease of OLD family